jgi:hypothetical protein
VPTCAGIRATLSSMILRVAHVAAQPAISRMRRRARDCSLRGEKRRGGPGHEYQ